MLTTFGFHKNYHMLVLYKGLNWMMGFLIEFLCDFGSLVGPFVCVLPI
jgi:hypothetical protein